MMGRNTAALFGPLVWAVGSEAQAPVELTAQQDHRRLMDLLGIETIRPGADPKNPQAPNAVNYDEAKANPTPSCPIPSCSGTGSA